MLLAVRMDKYIRNLESISQTLQVLTLNYNRECGYFVITLLIVLVSR
jgi:hypothetical protein